MGSCEHGNDRAPQKGRNFLACWANISFPKFTSLLRCLLLRVRNGLSWCRRKSPRYKGAHLNREWKLLQSESVSLRLHGAASHSRCENLNLNFWIFLQQPYTVDDNSHISTRHESSSKHMLRKMHVHCRCLGERNNDNLPMDSDILSLRVGYLKTLSMADF